MIVSRNPFLRNPAIFGCPPASGDGLNAHIIADNKLRTHDAVRLGVAATLIFARPIGAAHVSRKGFDDLIETRRLVRQRALLGNLEALILPSAIHHPLNDRGDRLAQQRIEDRTDQKALEAAERGAARPKGWPAQISRISTEAAA